MFRSGSRDTSKYTLNLIVAEYYIVFAHSLSGNVISNSITLSNVFCSIKLFDSQRKSERVNGIENPDQQTFGHTTRTKFHLEICTTRAILRVLLQTKLWHLRHPRLWCDSEFRIRWLYPISSHIDHLLLALHCHDILD